ncbi:MAG: HicB family protein [Ruminococcus sp.]|nr:HicB family protein [Ruminococcus sp.]
MIYSYPGCFFQRPDGKYCVVFPDLNNLAAFGNDFDDALSNAIDLLARYIIGLTSRNEKPPAPSDIQSLRPDISDEYLRAFLQTVNVDAEEYAKHRFNNPVQTTITLPQWLDEFAKRENINLSALAEAYLLNEYKARQK